MSNTKKSEELYKKALELIPGGVNSPVRSFKAVGCNPVFISKGKGAFLWDVDQNQYIDFINSWGALIHGHCHPDVIVAIEKALSNGTSFGACHEGEIELAEIITKNLPSIEKLRLVNSGTEAVMTAIRLARAYTKRNKIIKFDGCYHGHSDVVLSTSGSGITTFGLPSCAGVPKNTVNDTITLPYNDPLALEITLSKSPKEFASIILEPVVGNCGVILPKENFLQSVRELARKFGTVLIFDEVITGFRVSKGGAQSLFNITPDITTLGKIIGGGLPIGAVGGKKNIMDLLAPNGPVYQAGTLAGNPLSIASGIATLKLLDEITYNQLENTTTILCDGIKKINQEFGLNIQINRIGSMFSIFFTKTPVYDYLSAKRSETETYARFFRIMLSKGIYIAPSQFEANFVSTAHKVEHIKTTLDSYKSAMKELKII